MQGIRLELCMPDGHGLLSNVTRTFRENSLYISRADISTEGNIASNVFYVTDAAGRLADQKTIESVREKVGTSCLKVNYTHPSTCTNKPSFEKPSTYNKFSIGGLVSYLGLIRSCSWDAPPSAHRNPYFLGAFSVFYLYYFCKYFSNSLFYIVQLLLCIFFFYYFTSMQSVSQSRPLIF